MFKNKFKFKLSFTRKQIRAWEIIPKGYGVAYKLPYSDIFICYPFPINWIVGLCLEIWWRSRNFPVYKSKRTKDLIAAYDLGWSERGKKEAERQYLENIRILINDPNFSRNFVRQKE